jgi:hypothetical protein
MKTLLGLLFLLVVSLSTVRADPIVIASGGGHDIDRLGAFTWSLQNSDASIQINLFSFGAPNTVNPINPPRFALPGQLMNLDFRGCGTQDVFGTIIIDGITYPAFGCLQFVSSALTPPILGLQDVHIFGTFSFTGSVLYAGGMLILTGSGQTDATVSNPLGTDFYFVRHVTYTFETPEPTSVLLFGTALAGVAFRVRRKLRSKR